MIVHMWRRWKYSTFPVDESKRTVTGVDWSFFFGCRPGSDEMQQTKTRRVASLQSTS